MSSFPRAVLRSLGDWLRVRAGPSGAYGAGLHYAGKGKLMFAAEAFEDAQRLWERQLGRRSRQVALALAKRAWCYVEMGRVADGVRLYEQALAIESESGGLPSQRVSRLVDELERARGKLGG